MKALYDNLKAWGAPLFQTLHSIGSSKTATNSVQKVLARRHANATAINGVRESSDGKLLWVELGASWANKGDVLVLPGVSNLEMDVVGVDSDTGEVAVRKVHSVNLQAGITEVLAMYYTTPEVDSLTNAVKVALENATIRFLLDGADANVSESTVAPTTGSIGLPVRELPKTVRTFHRHDYAAATVTDAADTAILTTGEIIRKVLIAETAGAPLLFKVEGATAFIVPRGGCEIELYIPAGSDITVRSVSGDIDAGDLIINFVG